MTAAAMIIISPALQPRLAYRPPCDNSGAFPRSTTRYGCLYTPSVGLKLPRSSRFINRHLISISDKHEFSIVAWGLLTVNCTFSSSSVANTNIPFCHGLQVLESEKEVVSLHDNKVMRCNNVHPWTLHCNLTVTATNGGGTSIHPDGSLMKMPPSLMSINQKAVSLLSRTDLICSASEPHVANLTDIASCSSNATTKPDEDPVELIESRTMGPSYMDMVIVQDEAALGETEKHRRKKISQANRGKIPWNKGKSHSAETIAKIKDRTREAMRDPIIRGKLRYYGLTQSKETRLKISSAASKRWIIKKHFKQQQYTCITEWKESIASVARRGSKGEKEYQWNSFAVLKMQAQEENKRRDKSMASCKTHIRTIEHKKNIAEKIRAKWTDPNYRQNVIRGLNAYIHRSRQQVRETPTCAEIYLSKGENPVAECPSGQPVSSSPVAVDMVSLKPKLPYNLTSYTDPLALEKLDILRQMRFKRLAREAKIKEAVDRVWMLMAKAEKAVRILEIAATKDRSAMASLLETCKLLAEAAWSIQTAGLGRDDGFLASVRFMGFMAKGGVIDTTLSEKYDCFAMPT